MLRRDPLSPLSLSQDSFVSQEVSGFWSGVRGQAQLGILVLRMPIPGVLRPGQEVRELRLGAMCFGWAQLGTRRSVFPLVYCTVWLELSILRCPCITLHLIKNHAEILSVIFKQCSTIRVHQMAFLFFIIKGSLARLDLLSFLNYYHNHHPSYGRGCSIPCRLLLVSHILPFFLLLLPQPSSVIRKRLFDLLSLTSRLAYTCSLS